jgi:hypothetical protein
MIETRPRKARKERPRASSNAQGDGSPRGRRMTEKAAEIAGGSKGDAKLPYKQTATMHGRILVKGGRDQMVEAQRRSRCTTNPSYPN